MRAEVHSLLDSIYRMSGRHVHKESIGTVDSLRLVIPLKNYYISGLPSMNQSGWKVVYGHSIHLILSFPNTRSQTKDYNKEEYYTANDLVYDIRNWVLNRASRQCKNIINGLIWSRPSCRFAL